MRDIDDYRMGTQETVDRLSNTGRWAYPDVYPAFITTMTRVE
jgi:hypothetical protein